MMASSHFSFSCCKRSYQRGITFIEVSIGLSIIGLLLFSASAALIATNDTQKRATAVNTASFVQSAVRVYAAKNNRLPCPAIDKNGYEARDISGVCSATVQQTGFVPYRSLGLELPNDALFALYAVYRQSNVDPKLDTDLALSLERTGDTAGDQSYMQSTDLIAALSLVGTTSPTGNRPFLTGDAAAAGAVDCNGNRVNTAAYWILFPLTDANNDGDLLDEPHALNGLCATHPQHATTNNFDDLVFADTPLQLAGWLLQVQRK
jgi:type II secretory pathway pseudopilin PulG